MESLYKTVESKAEIFRLYDEKLAELMLPVNTKVIDTSFGKTNILITGDTTKPPIIVIHGANGCAPIAIETYIYLKDAFCIYAIDVLA